MNAYGFVLWLLPKAEGFARSYRYDVGERLVQGNMVRFRRTMRDLVEKYTVGVVGFAGHGRTGSDARPGMLQA